MGHNYTQDTPEEAAISEYQQKRLKQAKKLAEKTDTIRNVTKAHHEFAKIYSMLANIGEEYEKIIHSYTTIISEYYTDQPDKAVQSEQLHQYEEAFDKYIDATLTCMEELSDRIGHVKNKPLEDIDSLPPPNTELIEDLTRSLEEVKKCEARLLSSEKTPSGNGQAGTQEITSPTKKTEKTK